MKFEDHTLASILPLMADDDIVVLGALMEAAEDIGMPLSDAKSKDIYLKASGGKPFIPPLHAKRRAAKNKNR